MSSVESQKKGILKNEGVWYNFRKAWIKDSHSGYNGGDNKTTEPCQVQVSSFLHQPRSINRLWVLLQVGHGGPVNDGRDPR